MFKAFSKLLYFSRKWFTPTPILKKEKVRFTYQKFLSLFRYQKINSVGIGVSLHSKRGFTLVEIVVVIGIMGFLSAIIYSSFDASKATSRDQKRVSDISALQLSLEQYFNKNGTYPTTLNILVPTYISEIPKDPLTRTGYDTNYFPLTRVSNSPYCVSYQLWTKFEKSNSYLNSKKGFNSVQLPVDSPTSKALYECGDGHNKIDASASGNELIYDVTP